MTWVLVYVGMLFVAACIGLSMALIKLALHLLGIDNSL